MNLNHSTRCWSGEEIDIFQENVNKFFDSHEGLSIDLDLKSISYEILKCTSPNYIEND